MKNISKALASAIGIPVAPDQIFEKITGTSNQNKTKSISDMYTIDIIIIMYIYHFLRKKKNVYLSYVHQRPEHSHDTY